MIPKQLVEGLRDFEPGEIVKAWTVGKEVHYCTKDDRHYRILPDGRKYLVNHKEILNGKSHD